MTAMQPPPVRKKASAAASARKKALPDCVTHLPGYGRVDELQFAGYASVRGKTGNNGADAADEKLFYWFVGAPIPKKSPPSSGPTAGRAPPVSGASFLRTGRMKSRPTARR